MILIIAAAFGAALIQSAPKAGTVSVLADTDSFFHPLDTIIASRIGQAESVPDLPKPRKIPNAYIRTFVAMPSGGPCFVEKTVTPVWGRSIMVKERICSPGFFTPILVIRQCIAFYQLSRSQLPDEGESAPFLRF